MAKDKDKKIETLEDNVKIGREINTRLIGEITDLKVFEDLYYKENAKVGLLQSEVDFLKKQVDYLKAKIAFNEKYSK